MVIRITLAMVAGMMQCAGRNSWGILQFRLLDALLAKWHRVGFVWI
jgi:hypothetical protein